MGFYTAVAMVYGAICYIFVRFFAFLLLWSTRWFLLLGVEIWAKIIGKETNKVAAIWPAPSFVNLSAATDLAEANWPEVFPAFIVQLFLLVIVGLLVSFILSFYFSANTIIYSLMRNKVDGTAIEDVYTELDEATAEPTTSELESGESQPGVGQQE